MTLFYLCRHRFFPAHLRRAQPRTAVRIPTEPFSPNGLFRGRNGVPLIRARLRLLAGTVCRVRRYIRKRNDFPNRLRLQMLTGWAFCRVLCINAERVVVRICHGRGCWQAVRSAGQNRIPHRFPKCPHTYGVRKNQTAVRIPTEPFSPNGLVNHPSFSDSSIHRSVFSSNSWLSSL